MPSIGRPEILDGSFHHHLLRDRERLDGYAEAIRRVVKPGDVVADVGSGSGVLAWLAWRAGARKVHAVESNTNSYRMLLRLVRLNGATGHVIPTLGDGTQWTPPEDVDVVLCELMETGLLHESIAAVMRNVHAWSRRPRAIVPKSVRLLVEGVRLDDDYHGYRAPISSFRYVGEGVPLTDLVGYAEYDFEQEAPGERVEAPFTLQAREAGRLDGIQLRTRTVAAPGVEVGEGPAYCTPIVLTLPEPIHVEAGQRLRGRLDYDFDYTAHPITFELTPDR